MSEREDFFPPTRKPSTTGTLVYLMFGLLVWAAHLTIVYGGHTLLCALGFPPEAASWLVIAATAGAMLVVVCFLTWRKPWARMTSLPPDRTIDLIARLIAILSLVDILWAGAAIAFVTSCSQGR
ncbi:hypothetical protein [Nitratireductor luteus]|uniref:hypothetical protein n=1 Tax=Nitratireductor luteus TaxID=2976980 RepID=UPI002240A84F|nr:hypothetical protein [Nitratireductor luteus]